jgi:hypothetical protein
MKEWTTHFPMGLKKSNHVVFIFILAQTPPPSTSDLYKVAIQQGLPFVGFGFLDNFIMIVAGESIETFLGASLVISTMAAAALGNTLSDVFGIGSVMDSFEP